jgi:hypothetical protein
MNKPQRQDSLYDQLKDLIPLANKEGCYDAADYIRGIVEGIERKMENANDLPAETKTNPTIQLSAVLKAIEDEPEYPGNMPDEIYEAIKNDRGAMGEAMRITVRLTKLGIKNRVMGLKD